MQVLKDVERGKQLQGENVGSQLKKSEGEMWGFHMTNLDYWMENGNLAMNCIISHLQL